MTRLGFSVALAAVLVLSALFVMQAGPGTPTQPAAADVVPCVPQPASRAAVADPRDDRRRVAELERELAAARRRHAQQETVQASRIAELEAQVASLQRQRSRFGTDMAADAYAMDYENGATTARGRQGNDRDAVLFALEENLAMQPVDSDWERDIELDLYDLFAETPGLDDSALLQASCGSTFCRVEIEHADARAEARLLAAVARQSAWSADYQDVFQYRPAEDDHRDDHRDDGTTSVFFVSRKGFGLPMSID